MIEGSACRRVVALVAAALAASLGLNFYLVSAAHHYYKDATAIRLDPAGLELHAGDRASPRPPGPVLVVFGDSRAFMWTDPPAPGYVVVNRGVSYQTTAQMLLRFDADVASLRPAVIVLEAGVNDLKAIAEFPPQREKIIHDCESNLESIVHRSKDLGAQVVLVTVFRIGHVPLWRRPFWSSDVEGAVREVNAFLSRLAGDKVALFDANKVLVDDEDRIRPSYSLDFLHLSSNGYSALNEALVPLLRGLPKAP